MNMSVPRSLVSVLLGLTPAVCLCVASATPQASTLANGSAMVSVSFTAESYQGLFCSLPPPPQVPFCGSHGNTLTASVTGGTPPYVYSWTLVGDGKLTGGQGTETINFDIGAGGVTLTLVVTDAAGGTSQCSASIICEPPPPPPEFCALGQGVYGSARAYFNGTPTLALLEWLLSTSDLTVGKPGRSLRIQASAAGCIVQRLPATGTPHELPSTLGNATLDPSTCQTASASLDLTSTGKFHNVLLGQAIALSLNTRLSAGLAGLAVCNMMTTQAALAGPDGRLGTGDDIRSPGPDGYLGTSDDPITAMSVPSSVTTALSALGIPHTVRGLLELANRGLAGESTGGASLGDVNAAVNAVNVAFGGCRYLLSCSDLR